MKIQNNVSVYTGVTLEDDVFCGPSMVFTNVINPRSHVSRKDEFRQTLVRRGATLGANSTIRVRPHDRAGMPSSRAGAVVTRDVPDYALVVGNPGARRRLGVRVRREARGQIECPAPHHLRCMRESGTGGKGRR